MCNQTFINAKELANETIGFIEERYADSNTISGIRSGFTSIDSITHGFKKGNLITISSYASRNYELFMLQMIYNIAVKNKTPCGFFSYTMRYQEFGLHMINRASQISLARLGSGMLRPKDLELMHQANKMIYESSLIVSELYSSSFEELCNAIRRQVAAHDLKIVFINSLNSIPLDCEFGSIKARLLNIVKKLKILAMELEITIVVDYFIEDNEKEKTLERKTDFLNLYSNIQLVLQRIAANPDDIYQDYRLTIICKNYWSLGYRNFKFNIKNLSFEEEKEL